MALGATMVCALSGNQKNFSFCFHISHTPLLCYVDADRVMLQALSMPGDSGNSLMTPLISLAAALRDLGADVDPENVFAKFFVALRGKPTDADGQDTT